MKASREGRRHAAAPPNVLTLEDPAFARLHQAVAATPGETLAFVGLSENDRPVLESIHRLLAVEAPAIIDAFYDHLHRFPPLAGLLADAARVARLKATQRDYLLSLGRGMAKPGYVLDRLRIGLAHERVGLSAKWYIGAYARLYDLIAERLARRLAADAPLLAQHLQVLNRLLMFDSSLVVEAYHLSSVGRLNEAIEQLQAAEARLAELSRTDGLTGIANRKHLLELLQHEFDRSRRFARPLTLLFADVDHFKAVNDRHGHAAGDAVLRQVAARLRAALRPADIVGRYGGEEFLVGLVECAPGLGVEIAERVRRRIAEQPVRLAQDDLTVSASIGIAERGVAGESLDDWIARADSALYAAKAAGRNCVFMDGADEPWASELIVASTPAEGGGTAPS